MESPGGRKAWTLSAKKKLGVLYLIGEVPGSQLPPADFVIYQNPHPPDPLAGADLVLPAAASTETDGTTINGEGRIQKICQAVDPPGEALPDWLILSRIARKMGAQGFDFSTASQVRAEISGMVAGFKGVDKNKRDPRPFTCGAKMSGPGILLKKEAKAERRFPFRLYTSPPENWYRGFPLSEWVVGMRDLPIEGVLDISPVEARRAAISNGDRVVVTSPYFEGVWRARIVPGQPERILRATSMQGSPVGGNPLPVRIRKENV